MMDKAHHVSRKQGSVLREEYRPKLACSLTKHMLEDICGLLAVWNQTERALRAAPRAAARVRAPILPMRSQFVSELGRLICAYPNNPEWSSRRVPRVELGTLSPASLLDPGVAPDWTLIGPHGSNHCCPSGTGPNSSGSCAACSPRSLAPCSSRMRGVPAPP